MIKVRFELNYVGCDEIYCDECDFCPDSWFNEEDEEE